MLQEVLSILKDLAGNKNVILSSIKRAKVPSLRAERGSPVCGWYKKL